MGKAGDEEKPWQDLVRRVGQKKTRNRMRKKDGFLCIITKILRGAQASRPFASATHSPKMC